MTHTLDILIPTYSRKTALVATLTSLVGQTFSDFRVVISDQNEDFDVAKLEEIQAVANVFELHGQSLEVRKHLPRQGMAEQRQFLLDQAQARYALFIDDDLIFEPWVIELLISSIQQAKCGVIGSGVIGLSFLDDVRPNEQKIELWEGPVEPEELRPYTPKWERYRLHNAANLFHVQTRLGATPEQPLLYKIAWVGGCVLYDVEKLRSVGGFQFWQELPQNHCGEDVLAQNRVMARYGGAGVLPSGVYHMELHTTLPDRSTDAPYVLDLDDSLAKENNR